MYIFPERVTNVYDLKLLVHTLSHEFIKVSPIYDFCIKVCESKKTVCESNVYDLKLLVHTLSQEFILVSPIYDFCIKVCKSKKQSVNQMFTTSNYLYIHYLASLYRYLPFMTFA